MHLHPSSLWNGASGGEIKVTSLCDLKSLIKHILLKIRGYSSAEDCSLKWSFIQFESKSNQITQITFIVTSPQHKCLGEWNSYERAPDSAEKQQTIYIWTDSAKKQQTIYLWTDSAKKQQTIYLWTDSAKKQQTIYLWTDSAKKQQTIYLWTDSAKKQQTIYLWTDSAEKTTTIYIWTDSAKNNSNLHMDSTYLQTVQKTMCKIHIHILSTLSVL